MGGMCGAAVGQVVSTCINVSQRCWMGSMANSGKAAFLMSLKIGSSHSTCLRTAEGGWVFMNSESKGRLVTGMGMMMVRS